MIDDTEEHALTEVLSLAYNLIVGYKTVTMAGKDEQRLNRQADLHAQSITNALRLPSDQTRQVKKLVWWDPGFRNTGEFCSQTQATSNLAYALSHGVGLRDLVNLRKSDKPVKIDGQLRGKCELDAPLEVFWADTQSRKQEQEQSLNQASKGAAPDR